MARQFRPTKKADVWKGLEAAETLNGKGGDDRINGAGGNDTILGGGGDDRLNGGAGNDTILGGIGDDVITTGVGNDTVDGGAGDDIVKFAGNFADATVEMDGSYYKITIGTDVTKVKNVELFQFADGTVTAEDVENKIVDVTPLVLTAGVDTVVGTADDETLEGVVDTTPANGTLQLTDSVDLGAGTDTLNVRFNGEGLISTSSPVLKGVEIINATNLTTTGEAINGGVTPDMTTLNSVNSAGAIAATALSAKVTTLGLSGVAGDDVDLSATYASGLTGAADALTINVSNNSAATVADPTKYATIAVSGASAAVGGFESVTVNSTGAASRLYALTVTDSAVSTLKTLNVLGDKDFRIDSALDFAGTAGTLDASKFTGKLNVAFSADDVTVTGGKGDDRFNFANTLTSTDVVNGGDGNDTVAISDAMVNAAQTALIAAINKLTSIETLEMTAAAATLVASDVTAINSFAFSGATSVSVTGVQAGDSFALLSNLAAGATFAPALDSGADVLTLSTSGVTVVGGVTATNFETLNLTVSNVAGVGNVLNTVTVGTNAKIDIGGAGDVSLTVVGANATIDAADLTGKMTVTGSATNNSIIGGSNNDVITGAAGIDSIDLTKGGTDVVNISDNVTFATAVANRDVVTGFGAGAGGDIIDIKTAGAPTTDEIGTAQYKDFTGTATAFALANTFDVFEFGFDAGNNTANLANATDGTELFKAIANEGSSITALSLTAPDTGYIVAYDNGNAYVYYYDSADASLAATEIALVATLNGVAVGALTHDNFA